MNRILKLFATLVAVFALIAVVAAIILPKILDPNNYQDEITRTFHEETGMTLSIDGPIGWSVFPWLGLAIKEVSVKGPDGSPLATLGTAEVSVKLIPLLSKKVEMKTARLQGLDLNLIKNPDGLGNWESNRPEIKSVIKTPETTEEVQTASSSAMILPELNIASVEIKDIQLRYEDQGSGVVYAIEDASLMTGEILNEKPFDFQLKARMKSNNPELTLKTELSATLGIDTGLRLFTLDDLKLVAQPDLDKGESVNIVGHINLQQTDLEKPLEISGQLNITEFNPARLLSQLKIQLPPMASSTAMSQLSLKSGFQTDGKSFNADQLDLALDDFRLRGDFKITDLASQSMVFQFTGNDLNLDHYLPPPAASNDTGNSGEKTSEADATPSQEQPLIPEDVLRPLNLQGSVALNSLTASGLLFEKPAIKLNSAGGRQTLKVESGFYQGRIDLNGKLDVRKKGSPAIKTTAALKGINLEAMATPIPALKPIQGHVNADMDISTNGLVLSTLTQNLNGNVAFAIDEGAFTSANFDKLVCEGIAQIRNKTLSSSDWDKASRFQNLGGTFVIRNGVATNNNLTAALSNLNLKGDGNIDLVRQTLDYHVGLNISGDQSPDSDPACQVNEKYVNVTWPVRCQGKLGEQSCGLDTERLADTVADVVKEEAKGHLKKEIEKIEKKVEGPLKDALKGFFK